MKVIKREGREKKRKKRRGIGQGKQWNRLDLRGKKRSVPVTESEVGETRSPEISVWCQTKTVPSYCHCFAS